MMVAKGLPEIWYSLPLRVKRAGIQSLAFRVGGIARPPADFKEPKILWIEVTRVYWN